MGDAEAPGEEEEEGEAPGEEEMVEQPGEKKQAALEEAPVVALVEAPIGGKWDEGELLRPGREKDVRRDKNRAAWTGLT